MKLVNKRRLGYYVESVPEFSFGFLTLCMSHCHSYIVIVKIFESSREFYFKCSFLFHARKLCVSRNRECRAGYVNEQAPFTYVIRSVFIARASINCSSTKHADNLRFCRLLVYTPFAFRGKKLERIGETSIFAQRTKASSKYLTNRHEISSGITFVCAVDCIINNKLSGDTLERRDSRTSVSPYDGPRWP